MKTTKPKRPAAANAPSPPKVGGFPRPQRADKPLRLFTREGMLATKAAKATAMAALITDLRSIGVKIKVLPGGWIRLPEKVAILKAIRTSGVEVSSAPAYVALPIEGRTNLPLFNKQGDHLVRNDESNPFWRPFYRPLPPRAGLYNLESDTYRPESASNDKPVGFLRPPRVVGPSATITPAKDRLTKQRTKERAASPLRSVMRTVHRKCRVRVNGGPVQWADVRIDLANRKDGISIVTITVDAGTDQEKCYVEFCRNADRIDSKGVFNIRDARVVPRPLRIKA